MLRKVQILKEFMHDTNLLFFFLEYTEYVLVLGHCKTNILFMRLLLL